MEKETFIVKMVKKRREEDLIGEIEINEGDLRGINTHRALLNFPLEDFKLPFKELIKALFEVKLAALETNYELGYIPEKLYPHIRNAISDGINGKLNNFFNITMYQGGAGTSLNMNVNEVIANRALLLMGRKCGEYELISPYEHINLHQSTNDVIPTAGKIASLRLLKTLEDEVLNLLHSLQEKEREFDGYIKFGRTECQDGFPITLGREFSAYASAISRDRWRIFKCRERIREVNLGGTAIGTGYMAPKKYIFRVIFKLKEITNLPLARTENLIDGTQNWDQVSEVHGILSALATSLIKISSDLRFLSSGPESGIGEIILKPIQSGSSIMVSKINPVIPEFVSQCSMRVLSNNSLINHAISMGHLELNPFSPLIIHTLMESQKLLTASTKALTNCIKTLKANREKFNQFRNSELMLLYAISQKIGYKKAEKIFKKSSRCGKHLKDYLMENNYFKNDDLKNLLTPENLLKLGFEDENT